MISREVGVKQSHGDRPADASGCELKSSGPTREGTGSAVQDYFDGLREARSAWATREGSRAAGSLICGPGRAVRGRELNSTHAVPQGSGLERSTSNVQRSTFSHADDTICVTCSCNGNFRPASLSNKSCGIKHSLNFCRLTPQSARKPPVRRRCKNLRIPATPKANTIIWKLPGSGTAITDKLSTGKCALPPLGSLPVVIQRKSIGSPSARGVAREI